MNKKREAQYHKNPCKVRLRRTKAGDWQLLKNIKLCKISVVDLKVKKFCEKKKKREEEGQRQEGEAGSDCKKR